MSVALMPIVLDNYNFCPSPREGRSTRGLLASGMSENVLPYMLQHGSSFEKSYGQGGSQKKTGHPPQMLESLIPGTKYHYIQARSAHRSFHPAPAGDRFEVCHEGREIEFKIV